MRANGRLWTAVAGTFIFWTLTGTVEANDARALTRPLIPLATYWEQVRLEYDLDAVRRGEMDVPAVFATELPEDLTAMPGGTLRKQAFIRLVLPLILEANTRIEANRARLVELAAVLDYGFELSQRNRLWLEELAADYGLEPGSDRLIEELLVRVDIVPPSLALAQAVAESGWGTSRFAQTGRALYGQRTWSEADGLVPKARADGKTFRVKAFHSLLQSVRAYMRNLNTHPTYAKLRQERARMRREGRELDGRILAGALAGYAESGPAYVEKLRSLIDANSFRDFDTAQIEGVRVAELLRKTF